MTTAKIIWYLFVLTVICPALCIGGPALTIYLGGRWGFWPAVALFGALNIASAWWRAVGKLRGQS